MPKRLLELYDHRIICLTLHSARISLKAGLEKRLEGRRQGRREKRQFREVSRSPSHECVSWCLFLKSSQVSESLAFILWLFSRLMHPFLFLWFSRKWFLLLFLNRSTFNHLETDKRLRSLCCLYARVVCGITWELTVGLTLAFMSLFILQSFVFKVLCNLQELFYHHYSSFLFKIPKVCGWWRRREQKPTPGFFDRNTKSEYFAW